MSIPIFKKTHYCAPSFVRHAEPNPHVRQVRVGLFSTYLSHYASQYRVFRKVQEKKPSANISRICPPSSRVSPFCLRQSPTGRELDAIDFVAIAIPSLRSLRLSHIRRRRLIMPLVALVQKNRAHQRLRTNSGARRSLPRRRCSSRFVFAHCKCQYKSATNEQSAYCFSPQLRA